MDYYSIFKTQNSPEEFLIYGKVNKKLEPAIRTKANGETFTSYACYLFVVNGAEWASKHRKNFKPTSESKHMTFLINIPENVYNNIKEGDSILVIGGIESYTSKTGEESLKINFKQYRNNNYYENSSVNNNENVLGEVVEDNNDSPFIEEQLEISDKGKSEIEVNEVKQRTNSRGRKRNNSFDNVVVNKAL